MSTIASYSPLNISLTHHDPPSPQNGPKCSHSERCRLSPNYLGLCSYYHQYK